MKGIKVDLDRGYGLYNRPFFDVQIIIIYLSS